jgi:hypothetical protein
MYLSVLDCADVDCTQVAERRTQCWASVSTARNHRFFLSARRCLAGRVIIKFQEGFCTMELDGFI